MVKRETKLRATRLCSYSTWDGIYPVGNCFTSSGDFLVSVDIKDAYLHIPTFQPHQRFLGFAVAGFRYKFVALLFSLSAAPKVFNMFLPPVLGLLRTQGILILGYLEDLLFREQLVLKLR